MAYLEDRLNKEAARHGARVFGKVKNYRHRNYELACGHLRVLPREFVKKATSLRCSTCEKAKRRAAQQEKE